MMRKATFHFFSATTLDFLTIAALCAFAIIENCQTFFQSSVLQIATSQSHKNISTILIAKLGDKIVPFRNFSTGC
jgi:hypothetical protein